jgi:hypothetical protein
MIFKALHRGVAVVLAGIAIAALLRGIAVAQSTPTTSKGQRVELKFDLSKCEPMGPNLYKCPALDKPICTPEFNQPDVVCIHIGKKGSVFVMMPGGASD